MPAAMCINPHRRCIGRASRIQALWTIIFSTMYFRRVWKLQCSANGVARIFFGGGPIFRDLRRPTRFGGGGGVVAEIFRDRRKPGTFSGGGGGSSRIFLTSPISQPDSVGGGNFLGYFLTGGQDRSNYINSGHFFWTFPGHLEITRN